MLNPMQQQPMMPHQMAPLHHHQSHATGPMDQRGAMIQKHMQHMSAAGSTDMVDWRNGPTGGGLQVQPSPGCDPVQYRHGQAGPYPVPGAMNGVLHHQPPQSVRRQATGYPAGASSGPVYPSSAAGVSVTGPGYGQPPAGIKTPAGQYGLGPEYGRPMTNGYMSSGGVDVDMMQPSASAQMGVGPMSVRPMTSLPAGSMGGVKCQPPTQQQQATASAMSHYQQQQQSMYPGQYGPPSHQTMSRSSADAVQQSAVISTGPSGSSMVAASASSNHMQLGGSLHERLSAGDMGGGSSAASGRKSKDKMASSAGTAVGAADFACGQQPQQHRMAPYPTPQQYMQNKRAKYAGGPANGATSPEAAFCSSGSGRFEPSPVNQFSGAPRPLRHLGPATPEYVAGPRLMGPMPPGGGAPVVGGVAQGGPMPPTSSSSYPGDGANVFASSPPGYMQPSSRSPVCQGMGFSGQRSNYQLSPLPGNPTPPMTPGLCNGSGGPGGVMSGPQSAYYQSPVGVDQKPPFGPGSVMIDSPGSTTAGSALPTRGMDRLENPGGGAYGGEVGEPRLAFVARDGLIMAPFRLEHNLAISNLMFAISRSVYQHIANRPDFDVQLKCFHHEDQMMKTNWPASVSVSVNSIPLGIDRGDGHSMRPVFLKRVIQPGNNMLQIAVTNCCCSHLFVIQLVHRPTVRSAIQNVLSQRLVMADQSVTKIKRSLGQRNSMPGAMHDDLMKISLVCVMSRRRINLPARGIDCTHVQCFDLETYLRMNSECNAWVCPICNKPAVFDGLEVDQFVWGILQHLIGTQFMEVAVDQTASWKPVSMNGMLSPDNAGGQWLKAVSPEVMIQPTVNTWIAQCGGAANVPSPTSFGGASGLINAGNTVMGCGPPSGVASRPYVPGGGSASSVGSPWCPPPSVSTSAGSPPDYIGCLSQMSNAFLPATDEPASSSTPSGTVPTSAPGASHPPMHPVASGPPSSMSRQHSDHGSGPSLPPTPVGSQLSGSQICTPLDGQLLHPRTPSDAATGPASACTPGGPHLPSTPLDGSSSACSSSSQKSPSTSGNVNKRRESSNCGGSVPPQDGGSGSSNDALADVQLCGAGDVGSVPGDVGIGHGSRPGSGATDNSGIDPADQEALDMLPDNLDDPMELLTYLGPNGGQSATDGLDCSDTDILSMFSC